MRPFVSFATLLVLAAGCNRDYDQDGLTDSEEEELGTDPEMPDTDEDTLGDFEEVRKLRTSPTQADTDCDGFQDPEELDASTDPLLPLDYPRLKKRWPDLSCHAPTDDLGFRPNKVVENVKMFDQFGQGVHLHQFYGHVILLDMSAGWCPPCRDWAAAAQPLYEKFQDDGFVIIHSMVDDYSQDSALTDDYFLTTWADEYGLTFPVVDDNRVFKDSFEDAGYNVDDVIPFVLLIGRDMKVRSEWTGFAPEIVDMISKDIRDELDEPPPWE